MRHVSEMRVEKWYSVRYVAWRHVTVSVLDVYDSVDNSVWNSVLGFVDNSVWESARKSS
jgi:hypothetical protein